jgi:hypothetical protein
MGGMTIMALADRHPELFGARIVGVALLSTSTGRLAEVSFGLPSAVAPVTRRVVPFLTRGMRARPTVFERGRRMGTDLAFVLARHGAFGSRDVSPSLVQFVERMTAATPVDVIAEFYDTFTTHDKLAALERPARRRDARARRQQGPRDAARPQRGMAAGGPERSFVVVEGAGHMVQLERAALVTLQLRAAHRPRDPLGRPLRVTPRQARRANRHGPARGTQAPTARRRAALRLGALATRAAAASAAACPRWSRPSYGRRWSGLPAVAPSSVRGERVVGARPGSAEDSDGV